MTKRMLAGFLAAISLGLISAAAAAAECKLERMAAVEVDINPGGGVMVPIQINGHDVWMTLNMATGMPVINPASMKALGLKPRPVSEGNRFINGVKVRQQTEARSLRIGSADFTDWTLYIPSGESRPAPVYKGKPVVGVLAAVFMNVVDLELDLAGRKMNLFKQAYCGESVAYWGGEVTTEKLYRDQGGLLFFPMEIDGQRVDTSFNTVDRRSWLNERVTKDFFGFDISSPGVVRTSFPGPNGSTREFGVRSMKLSARGLDLADVPITVQGYKAPQCVPTRVSRESGAIGLGGCVSIVPMELGTDVLTKLRIYIASKENRVYFTRVGPAAQPLQ